MKKVLQKYGILFFFCAIMGGIIMVDSIFALSFTDRERGLAANFSNSTKKISILQADSQDSFSQADLMYFLQDKRKSETVNYHSPKGKWLLKGAYAPLFKKFDI